MKRDDVEHARALVARGQFAAANPLLLPWVDLHTDPGAAEFEVIEANYLALRTMPEEGHAEFRDKLERWLWYSPAQVLRDHVSLGQVMQTLGLSAIRGGRPRRAVRAFARALRDGRLSRTGRAMLIESATDALSELGRFRAARSLALQELARAPHAKMDWLYLRRAALASDALGERGEAAEYARRCVEHPFFPQPTRSELEPLLRDSSTAG